MRIYRGTCLGVVCVCVFVWEHKFNPCLSLFLSLSALVRDAQAPGAEGGAEAAEEAPGESNGGAAEEERAQRLPLQERQAHYAQLQP